MPGQTDLLLVFYISVGQLPPKEAMSYLDRIRRNLKFTFPDGVSVLFLPTRNDESRIQPIPIKGFLDGTIKETPQGIEKVLQDMLAKIKTIKAEFGDIGNRAVL
jgi:hypothetical protein